MNTREAGTHRAVLFDLDGTLVDTAPDMVVALQELQELHGKSPVDYEYGRSNVSNGAIGLLRIAFPAATDAERDALMCEYIDRYARRVCDDSRIFDGLDTLLERLDAVARPWGVVTNKPGYLTEQIMQQLGLSERSACTVSGDTLKVRKPDPGPLVHACELAGIGIEETIYVGDAARDIEAGRAAGMTTIAATYGYITAGDDPAEWGADMLAANTEELAQIVIKAVNL